MAGRRTNLALLVLLLVAFATGVLAYAIGTGWNEWVVVVHATAGIAIVLLVPWKSIVVRRGLQRSRPGRGASLALMIFVVMTILAGVFHSTGLIRIGSLTSMQLHVGAAIGAVLFGVWHVVTRRTRLDRTDLSRRNAVKALALVGSAGAVYLTTEGAMRLIRAPGANRRFTGSHEQGSGDPDRMPVTQWLNDSVPEISTETWSLSIGGRSMSYEELYCYDDRVTAVLDCTGGWFAEQEWSGVRMSRLFPNGIEGRSVRVTSVTGYSRRFTVGDLENLLLATRVDGRALSHGHGSPVRLVAPGRRGFWWVKWVAFVDPSPLPEWAQLPFPVS